MIKKLIKESEEQIVLCRQGIKEYSKDSDQVQAFEDKISHYEFMIKRLLKSDATNINEGSIPNQSMVEGEKVDIKTFLIKFQEYTYQKGFLNANFTHNFVANSFLESTKYRCKTAKSTSENEKLKAEVQELREVLSESITEIIKLKIHYKDSGHGKKFIKKVESLLAKRT